MGVTAPLSGLQKKDDISLDYLRRRDTALAAVLDSIFDGVYIVDCNRGIVYWNRGAEEITGYRAGEVAGRFCSDNILNHIDADGTPLCTTEHCPITRTLSTGETVRLKVWPMRKTGGRVPVMTHSAPIRDAAGNIIAAIEVFRDISKEEDLRALQEKFNNIIRKYVSETAYEEVLSLVSRDAPAGTRKKDVTIMFADVVGFTGLFDRYEAEVVIDVLNRAFGVCEFITYKHHGDIDKFIGDSIMAVFPDANDAVEAASIILYETLPSLNRFLAEEGMDPVSLRIGINSGMGIHGDVGTSKRKDLTVIGDVVNTASRIQKEAEPDTIVVSEATYSRLRDHSRFESLRSVIFRGKKLPVNLYRFIRPDV